VPRRFSDRHESGVFRIVDASVASHGAPASNIKVLDEHGCVIVCWRSSGQSAVFLTRDALHLGALVLPASMLNPEACTIPVLNVETVDAHPLAFQDG
jgi:hypothetical protein